MTSYQNTEHKVSLVAQPSPDGFLRYLIKHPFAISPDVSGE